MKKYSSLQKISVFKICVCFLLIHLDSFAQVGIATTTPLSTFEVNGSNGQTITTTTSDLNLDASHSIIICNNGSATRTITLPNAVGVKGRIYSIKRDENSIENVNITTTASQLIDDKSNYILSQAKETISVISDGTNWKLIGRYTPQIPVGELSYFSTTGSIISINTSTTDGSTDMFVCNPETTIAANSVNFNSSENGRLQYTGTTKQSFRITATVSIMANSNGLYLCGFRKSNTSFLSTSRVLEKLNLAEEKTTCLSVFVTLEPNDFIELWVGKIGGTGSVTIKSLNLFASGL